MTLVSNRVASIESHDTNALASSKAYYQRILQSGKSKQAAEQQQQNNTTVAAVQQSNNVVPRKALALASRQTELIRKQPPVPSRQQIPEPIKQVQQVVLPTRQRQQQQVFVSTRQQQQPTRQQQQNATIPRVKLQQTLTPRVQQQQHTSHLNKPSTGAASTSRINRIIKSRNNNSNTTTTTTNTTEKHYSPITRRLVDTTNKRPPENNSNAQKPSSSSSVVSDAQSNASSTAMGRIRKMQRIQQYKTMERGKRHYQQKVTSSNNNNTVVNNNDNNSNMSNNTATNNTTTNVSYVPRRYSASPVQKVLGSTSSLASEPQRIPTVQQSRQHQQHVPIKSSFDAEEEDTLISVRQIVSQSNGGSGSNNRRQQQQLLTSVSSTENNNNNNGNYSNNSSHLYNDTKRIQRGSLGSIKNISRDHVLSASSSSQVAALSRTSSSSSSSSTPYANDIQQNSGTIRRYNRQHQLDYNPKSPHPNPASPRRQGKKREDDDNTYDYGRDEEHSYMHAADDNDSQVSLSYEQRRLRDKQEREARQAAVSAAKNDMEKTKFSSQYSLETPIAKTAVGVAGAAALGCIVMGPVGLLIGAAAVGIGVGVMQIPEEQRHNMQNKASKTMQEIQQQAMQASDTLSNSCAVAYRETGVADHVPPEMQAWCSPTEDEDKAADNDTGLHITTDASQDGIRTDRSLLTNDPVSDHKKNDLYKQISPARAQVKVREKKDKIACLRTGAITPAGRIYSLDPSEQPRAWLDVLASAEATGEEKMEAMEEILILAKDKQRARIFLEEGILDSLMWTLGRYFEKSNANPATCAKWANPQISLVEQKSAKLAAQCAVCLGKAHCNAIHTEGDLLLMSLYERGTVPEERQLAQMLHEVPHHSRATVTSDPTIITVGAEVFVLQQYTLPQAEEYARSIKSLVDGNVWPTNPM